VLIYTVIKLLEAIFCVSEIFFSLIRFGFENTVVFPLNFYYPKSFLQSKKEYKVQGKQNSRSKSVEHGSFGRPVICSLRQDIPQRPRLATIYFGVQFQVPALQCAKESPLIHFLRQLNPALTHAPYHFKIYFNDKISIRHL
jgi:hypothetical protein